MIKCPYCMSTMVWQSDFNYDEAYGEGAGVVTVYMCSNEDCNALGEFSLKDQEE